MCGAFLTWKDLPNVADMSIDTQLKRAGRHQLVRLCTVTLLCNMDGDVSHRSERAKPQVSCSPTIRAPVNPVQCGGLIAVCPRAPK